MDHKSVIIIPWCNDMILRRMWYVIILKIKCLETDQLRPFWLTWLTLIPAWINNHMQSKMSGEFTDPFPNFSFPTVEVWEWISNFIPHFIMNVILYPLHFCCLTHKCFVNPWRLSAIALPAIIDDTRCMLSWRPPVITWISATSGILWGRFRQL